MVFLFFSEKEEDNNNNKNDIFKYDNELKYLQTILVSINDIDKQKEYQCLLVILKEVYHG